MAKQHPNMAQTLKRLRRAIEQDINEKMLRLGERASEDIGNAMVDYCKNLLLTRATPAPQSQGLINQIAESIRLEDANGSSGKGRAVFSSTKNNRKFLAGKVLKVPIDKDKLVVFLEYGTGLEGANDGKGHPEASAFGWEYAINDGVPREMHKTYTFAEISGDNKQIKSREIFRNQEWYVNKFGRRGFVFKYKGREYLDSKDIVFKNVHDDEGSIDGSYLRLVVPKKGKQKPYWRMNRNQQVKTDATKSTYAFSSGLKPLRFIYDTRKQGLPKIISDYKEFMK